jgi:hypothetical protein
MKRAFLSFVLVLGSVGVFAQAPSPTSQAPDMVEVEPIKCWWRTSTSAVRTGEAFGLTLTCAVVETDTNKVVPDFSKLDPTVVQLPPFEVLGGTHPGDLVVPGKRFFQYDYRLRLIAEDAFGNDVSIPPLEVSYRIESRVTGSDTAAQGIEQQYSLPRASVRLISIVPDDSTDIRETPATMFTSIENRESRANLLQTVAGVLFGLAAVVGLVMLIGMLRRKAPKSAAVAAHLGPRTILSAVARELKEVQAASRGGWTPELVGRALAALRITGAYATNRAVGQHPSKSGEVAREGVVVVRPFGRAEVFVSGGATAETAAFANAPGLSDALRTLTMARYGRVEKFDSMADEALQAAIRLTSEQQSAHSLIKEWAATFKANVVDLRRKVWS